VRSLKARRTVTSVCKAGVCSRASESFKDGTPRWEFRCKLHDTKTLNTRGLEPRKLEDEESKVVTDRQRNTMVKAKKRLRL
jgi:hypothetical protein